MELSKLAIIGLGSIGKRHLEIAKRIRPELNISTISSKEKPNQNKLVDQNFLSIDSAISFGIEAAIISNPAPFHINCAIELLDAGVHILIEKPLSNNSLKIDQLINAEKKSSAKALIGYCYRYDKNGIFFKKMIMNKKIGTILSASINCSSYLPEWRNDKDYKSSVSARKDLGGGVLLELSHEIDYSYWLFDDFTSVYCSIVNSGELNIDSEDIADIILISKEKFPVNIHLDFNSRVYNRMCTVRGTKGNLVWDIFEKRILLQKSNENSKIIYNDIQSDMYYSQLVHFFDCIENNADPCITLNDGVASMKLIDASKQSNEAGKVKFLR